MRAKSSFEFKHGGQLFQGSQPKQVSLEEFLRDFADWDRPGFDLQQALAVVKQD